MPLTREFEVDLAARFDDYSDVGSTSNPRVAAKYKMDNVLFRASVGTGFRAPSLQSINDEGGYGFPAFVDAVACKLAKSSGNQADVDANCGQRQYRVETTAAENLKPEKTLFSNVGVVFEPSSYSNVGLDFWMLRIKDKIGIPDYYLLTKAESEGSTGYENSGISILRDGNGVIDTMTIPKANLSKVETAGIDLTGGLNFGERADVQFSWGLDLSYSLYYREAAYEGQQLVDRIGTVGKPQWKAANNFTTIFANNHIGGLTARTNSGTEKANPEAGDIPIHTEWDVQYTFNAFYNGSISVGAVNVFNRRPPKDETQTPTVDLSIYNSLGRSAYVKVAQDF
jgi:iron complex outermembrane receptor protein